MNVNIPEWLKRESTQIGIYIVLIIGTTILFANWSKAYFSEQSQLAFQPIDSAYAANVDLLKQNKHLTDTSVNLLLQKVELLEFKKKHHRFIFSEVYKSYYATVTVFPILSGILVIISFLIAQNGWSNCSNTLKSIFLIFAFLSSIYGLYPTIYRHNQTVNDNLVSYTQLNAIQKQIFDYAITAPDLYQDQFTLQEFVNKINQEEKNVEGIYFGLELKALDDSLLKDLKE